MKPVNTGKSTIACVGSTRVRYAHAVTGGRDGGGGGGGQYQHNVVKEEVTVCPLSGAGDSNGHDKGPASQDSNLEESEHGNGKVVKGQIRAILVP